MAKKTEEATILSTLQDLLIFQMAAAGVSQSEIRKAVRLDMNRVARIARLAKALKSKDNHFTLGD